jgi:hypothetical protein
MIAFGGDDHQDVGHRYWPHDQYGTVSKVCKTLFCSRKWLTSH